VEASGCARHCAVRLTVTSDDCYDLKRSLITSILAGILFFILSLIMGASFSWSDARFIAPLVVSVVLIPAFFVWESRIPARDALIPPVTWTAKNFTMWIILSMFGYAWWTCNQIPTIEVWINERGDKPIVAAARLLPSGGFSVLSSFVLM